MYFDYVVADNPRVNYFILQLLKVKRETISYLNVVQVIRYVDPCNEMENFEKIVN